MPARRSNDDYSSNREYFLPLAALILIVVGLGIGVFSAWSLSNRSPEEARPAEQQAPDQGSSEEGDEKSKPSDHVQEILDSMTLEEKVAQMFVVQPEAIINIGTAVAAGDATREALEANPVGGFIYFSDNLVDADQTKEMLANTQTYAKAAAHDLPLFLCVDEEGGSVTRIAGVDGFGVENVGDMRAIGDSGDVQRAQDVGRQIGTYVRELGFNVDFAPVCDIATSDSGTMSLRAFGSTADAVSPMVEAQVRGFSSAGVLCSAKHFPGIGGAEGDSHNESIYSSRTLDEMRSEELKPFEAAIKAGVPMVMVGHLTCETATGSDAPASVNKAIVSDLLRGELSFGGLIVTDSMQMGAITERYGAREASVAAIQAGVDIVLLPEDYSAAFESVVDAVNAGTISEERINESVSRIIECKLGL